jgi:RecB family exonuclease
LNGSGLAVTGRVDRIDVDGAGRALVRDYKGRQVVAGARWVQDGKLQAALYALAAQELLGLEPAGALYQPIGRSDARPRGLVRAGTPGRYVNGDVVEPEALDAALGEARALAVRTARAMRAGEIRPCPSRCSPNGCAYPGICRAAEGAEGTAPGGRP